MKNKLSRPVLFTFVGLPGSGKTFLSRQLADKLEAVHISAEEIRFELFEKPTFSPEEEGVVKHMMLMMTERFLNAGLSVVYDVSLNKLADRREIKNIASKLKAETMLIWQQIDPQTAFSRVSSRSEKNSDNKFAVRLDKDTFKEISTHIQTPTNEEAVVVSGKHSFTGQLASIIRRLFELQLIEDRSLSKHLPNPGMFNLIAQTQTNLQRRNVRIG
ncbi:AAA family ATPase [Candidatus Saccharibacteria bacterium]|nr:AAA family ATPase [Candidatus Saccharibacteria bacterium]MCB9821516.1 AAA family ATPase [Candidatus Nomurabacteria bacterium]